MQTRAWYFIEPNGTRHGPSYTEIQAKIEASRYAAKRSALPDETAMTLFRSLAKAGWKVRHTGMRAERESNRTSGQNAPTSTTSRSIPQLERMIRVLEQELAEDSLTPEQRRASETGLERLQLLLDLKKRRLGGKGL